MINSPLRYPGGKTKAMSFLKNVIPDFYELREPFFGGGAFSFYCLNMNKGDKYLASDINFDLYCFWKQLRDNSDLLIDEIQKVYNKYSDGRILFNLLKERSTDKLSDFQRSVDFFILNRITFSGVVHSGGYSEGSFQKRFTQSSIDRLKSTSLIIQKIDFYCEDYSKLLNIDGKDVFIFLDPPYYSTKKSKLYGKNGILHLEFDHNRFFDNIKNCKHKWLITYDDHEYIRDIYNDFYQWNWKLQYGMNNYKKNYASKGSELLIANYDINNMLKSYSKETNKIVEPVLFE